MLIDDEIMPDGKAVLTVEQVARRWKSSPSTVLEQWWTCFGKLYEVADWESFQAFALKQPTGTAAEVATLTAGAPDPASAEPKRIIGTDRTGKPIRVGNIIRTNNDDVGQVVAIHGESLIFREFASPHGRQAGGFDADWAYNCWIEHESVPGTASGETSQPALHRGPVDVLIAMQRTMARFRKLQDIVAGEIEEPGTLIPRGTLDDGHIHEIRELSAKVDECLSALMHDTINLEAIGILAA